MDAIRAIRDNTSAVRDDAYNSQRHALNDASRAISSAAVETVRAAQDAAEASADETFYTDTHQAVAGAVRVARAENLAAAVVAEAALNQFELGHAKVSGSDSITPGVFLYFTRTAVAVETLVRSEAWHALQQSLGRSLPIKPIRTATPITVSPVAVGPWPPQRTSTATRDEPRPRSQRACEFLLCPRFSRAEVRASRHPPENALARWCVR